jgi:hypothetical protein
MAVHLNRLFKLQQPGKYSVQVQILLPELQTKSYMPVASGLAPFDIVEKLSPAEIATRDLRVKQLKACQEYLENLPKNRP